MDRHYRHTAFGMAALLVLLALSTSVSGAGTTSHPCAQLLLTEDPPVVNDTTLYACEDLEEDSTGIFFPLSAGYISSNSTTITYHITELFAQLAGDSITVSTLQMGYTAMDSTIIYVRVTDTINDCFDIGEILLRLRFRPELQLMENDVCASDSTLLVFDGQAPFTLTSSNGPLVSLTDSLYLLAPMSIADSTLLEFTLLTDSFACEAFLDEQVGFHRRPTFDIVDSVVCSDSPWLLAVDAVGEYELFSENGDVQGVFEQDTLSFSVSVLLSEYIRVDSIRSTLPSACGSTIPDSILIHPRPVTLDTTFQTCTEQHLLDLDSLGLILIVDQEVDIFWSSQPDMSDTLDPSISIPLVTDTLFYYSVLNDLGCSLFDSVLIDLVVPPTIDLGADIETCVDLGDSIAVSGIDILDPQFTSWEVTSGGLPFDDAVLVSLDSLLLIDQLGIAGDLALQLTVTTDGYLECPSVSDTLDILLHPLPSLDTVTLTACEGDSIALEGIVNASMLDFSWGELMGIDISVDGLDHLAVSSNGAPMVGVLYVTLQSEFDCVSISSYPIELMAYPEVEIMALGLGDGEAFCIGQEVQLSATEESDQYEWTLPSDISSSDTSSPSLITEVIGDSLSAHVILTQTNFIGGGKGTTACITSDSIMISAQHRSCTIDSVYRLPGGIYVAVMADLPGHDNYYRWIGVDGLPLDEEDALLVVLPGETVPISLESSHYAEGICECNLDFALGGIPPQIEGRLRAAPNPTIDGSVRLFLPAAFDGKAVTLTLTDPRGREVLRERWTVEEPIKSLMIPEEYSGNFVLRITSDALSVSRQLIVR